MKSINNQSTPFKFFSSLTFNPLKKVIVSLIFLFSFFNAVKAQNASYSGNAIPITGTDNSAFGFQSLKSNLLGYNNSSFGWKSLFSNTNGSWNAAFGYQSLNANTIGTNNAAFGIQTLLVNSTGSANAAFGAVALYSNTTGGQNTAIGGESLRFNTIGTLNTGVGNGSLLSNSTGSRNSSGGWASLAANTTGSFNTSFGAFSLPNNVSGTFNTSIGYNTNVGVDGLTNATAIGNGAIVNASNTMQFGNSAVTEIYAGTGINAKVIAGGLQIKGGVLGAGKVLTSDAAGNATWQTPIGGGGGGTGWSLIGNAGTVDGINSLGTTDNIPLNFIANSQKAARLDPILQNSFFGILGGTNNTTGTNNTALGYNANMISGTLTNATAIGYNAIVNASNTIQLGSRFVTKVYAGTGINATIIAGGLQVTGGTLAVGNVLTSDAFGVATWQTPTGGGGSGWGLTGNAGTVDGTNFIGTTDNVPFNIRVNNKQAGRIDPFRANTFYGQESGINNTGTYNTGNGFLTLRNNTTGEGNVAIGYEALIGNTTGDLNTALGYATLRLNNGSGNIAVGHGSLGNNTVGSWNIGIGENALGENKFGSNNIALGNSSLVFNNRGEYNIAIGKSTLINNNLGNLNTGIGYLSLLSNTDGEDNIACGSRALFTNTIGALNAAFGSYANVSTGGQQNATALGANAVVNASNKVRLGSATVTEVEGPTYNTISDGRFKNNISESDVKGLAFINKLRPVAYNFDTKKFTAFLTQAMPDSISEKYLDKDFAPSTAIRQSGFIAQEVEAAAKETGYNFNGVHVPETKDDNYSLAYAQFTVPLVKAVQELSKQNDELKKEMVELRSMLTALKSNTIEGSIKITEAASEAKLYQNAPNPFSKTTTIRYSLPISAKRAAISITSIEGIKIKTYELNSKNGEALNINGGELSAGTYIYTLVVDDVLVDSKKMILTK